MSKLLDPHDDNVGAVLECAIKWTVGRKTYMVSVVTGVISSVVPDLNNKTLLLMEREIVKHERFFDSVDKKELIPLRDTLRREIDKRNLERWK